MKETLTTTHKSFGSTCEIKVDFLSKVMGTGIVDMIKSWAELKVTKNLKKGVGTKNGRIIVDKLDDANDAGKNNAHNFTLILTQGDSAKALAVAGISVVGRNTYGVFPLRGKLVNVREASHKQIKENNEIAEIEKILGLQHGKVYTDVKSLRYGSLMIMTDQDHDGFHIKGLLINLIHSFWPELLKIKSFLVEFITPIVKATRKGGTTKSFYSMPEYESWKESLQGNACGREIKYYKGLGTSIPEEGKEYFKDLNSHKKEFCWEDDQDGEAIEMAFSKKKIEARKNWLQNFEPGTFLDPRERNIKYSDFVNKEFILFSLAGLQRSIPSMVDGLKPGQRKILFSSLKRNFVQEAKVAQFSGYVSEHSAYHHGEQSFQSTIVGMAQHFVGSNNINLLEPKGQFGSRAQNKLGVYLAPFLHGNRYTSFGRHFTKVNKLQQIVDKLHWYTQNGDTIVDFGCGSNDFSLLLKDKLEETRKTCYFRNFDIIHSKNDFCFERRDWMTVTRNELPAGDNLIMGLNPPFGPANQLIDKALEFRPKLVILIVPPGVQRV